MSENKIPTNKKKPVINDSFRNILNIIFAVISVVSFAVTVILSPIGDKVLGRDEEKSSEKPSKEVTSENTDSTEIRHGLYYDLTLENYYWPEPTEPTVDTLTPYNIVVNSYRFNYVNEAGVTTVYAKEDISATMTIKPLPSVEYATLVENIDNENGKPVKDKTLPAVEISCCYSYEEDDRKTVIYCVDDLKGGSIEIRYSYPTSYENSYENQFELMLTMFKLAY